MLALHSSVGWAGDNTPVYERYFARRLPQHSRLRVPRRRPGRERLQDRRRFQLLNSLEYQVPLVAKDAIYAVGFIDSGTVESRVEIKDYRVSAGVGLRIVVPMLGQVPIALDFGFPIVKGPSDNTQVFSFLSGFFR